MKRRLVEIFSGSRKAEAYLYVDKADGLAQVPESLLEQIGQAKSVMTMLLDRARKLARAKAAEVLDKIVEQGCY